MNCGRQIILPCVPEKIILLFLQCKVEKAKRRGSFSLNEKNLREKLPRFLIFISFIGLLNIVLTYARKIFPETLKMSGKNFTFLFDA